MNEVYIQSRQNEQVKDLVKLRERKHRERRGCFLVEGLRELGHALGAGFVVETVFFCPELFPSAGHSDFVDEVRRGGCSVLVRMSAEAFSKAAFREGPDGLMAVARQQSHALADLKLSDTPLLLVLEGIEKPGNLGAILRSADGAGVEAVILVDCVLDLYNPNAIRSSQGLVFALPIAHAGQEDLREFLVARRFSLVATTPDAESFHWDIDYRGGTALLMGSESQGLSPFWLRVASERVRIPMTGRADSLNVAAATAVCLYEARRQRSQRMP